MSLTTGSVSRDAPREGVAEENYQLDTPPTLQALTGVRFLAALLVIFHHFWPLDSIGTSAWLTHAPSRLVANGYLGVSLFFVLSGFILTYTHGRFDSVAEFSRRRFWIARWVRIYPLYLLALFVALPELWVDSLTVLESNPGWPGIERASMKGALVLALLQAWVPGAVYHWNSPAWSLSVEASFYLLFPFLLQVQGLRKATQRQTLAGIVVLWGLVWCVGLCVLSIPETVRLQWGAQPLLRLPEFITGMLLARVHLAQRASLTVGVRSSLSVASMLAIAGICWSTTVLAFPPELLIAVNLPLITVLIGCLSHGAGPISAVLAHPIACRLGEASYAMYLLHVPIAHRMLESQGPGVSKFTPGSFLLYLLVLIGVSIVVARYYERPLRSWLRRLWLKP